MPVDLLAAKTLLPPLRPEWVERPRLLEQLDQGFARRLILLAAPAGYGKTTLLSTWIRRRGLPCAWISLEEDDNDPLRFLSYACAAMQAIDPAFGALAGEFQGAEGGLSVQSAMPTALESLLTAFLNRLHAIPGDFLLALDDFHAISAPPVLRVVAELLDHMPAGMHLAIASRADPPLPLARLRARGQVTEIRLAQLRFSANETGAFIRQAGGLPLLDADIAALAERTEGWAAGLQMAVLALQSLGPDAPGRLSQAIQNLTGSNRYILDYLMEEVLDRQPARVRAFLEQTSVLERFNGALCSAVISQSGISQSGISQLGISDQESEAVEDRQSSSLIPNQLIPDQLIPDQQIPLLTYLDRSNLFVIPLDDQREWYRYHRLFADLLRKRLNQEQPGLAAKLHARASRWFEEHGCTGEAIRHAVQARDFERAARLVEQAGEDALLHGQTATLLEWIAALPEAQVQARPRLVLYLVTARMLLGDAEPSRGARLQPARQPVALEQLERYPELAGELDVLRAHQAVLQTRITEGARLALRAQQRLPENALFYRSMVTWVLGYCQISDSELDQRIALIEGMLRSGESTENHVLVVDALCILAEARIRQGNLPLARLHYQQALQSAVAPDGSRLPVAGEALIGLGHLLREWNDLENAARCIEEGIPLLREVRGFDATEGWVALALCRQAQGDAAAAFQALESARLSVHPAAYGGLAYRMIDFYEAMIRTRLGDDQAVNRYFEQKSAAQPVAPQHQDFAQPADTAQPPDPAQSADIARVEAHIRKYEQVAWAHAMISQRRTAEVRMALNALDQMLPEMARHGRWMLVIEIQMLRALAHQALGSASEAQAAFEQALITAEPGGWVRLFVDEGPAILPLLERAIARGVCAGYAARLLSALRPLAPSPAPIPPPPPAALQGSALPDLPEPLSPREREVLDLLAGDLPAKAIAARLCVSETTLNSHIKNIYSKLGVHRRIEAIQKARRLKIL